MSRPPMEWEVRLWDAINDFADGSRLSIQRQKAVVVVMDLVVEAVESARREALEAAAKEAMWGACPYPECDASACNHALKVRAYVAERIRDLAGKPGSR